MPAKFTRCVRNGGAVRTVKPTKTTHMPICKTKHGWVHGEVHRNKTAPRK